MCLRCPCFTPLNKTLPSLRVSSPFPASPLLCRMLHSLALPLLNRTTPRLSIVLLLIAFPLQVVSSLCLSFAVQDTAKHYFAVALPFTLHFAFALLCTRFCAIATIRHALPSQNPALLFNSLALPHYSNHFFRCAFPSMLCLRLSFPHLSFARRNCEWLFLRLTAQCHAYPLPCEACLLFSLAY